MRSIIELILVVRQYENIVSYLNMEFKHVYNIYTVELIILMNAVQLFKMKGENRYFFVKPVTCLEYLSISIVSGGTPETYILVIME